MTFSKEYIDLMAKRAMQRIEWEIYTAVTKPSFFQSYGPPMNPQTTEYYRQHPGNQSSIPFSKLIHCFA